MTGGKRPLSVKTKLSKESAVEDKETPFDQIEGMDQESDDEDSSDSSVYSELEEGKHLAGVRTCTLPTCIIKIQSRSKYWPFKYQTTMGI